MTIPDPDGGIPIADRYQPNVVPTLLQAIARLQPIALEAMDQTAISRGQLRDLAQVLLRSIRIQRARKRQVRMARKRRRGF